VRPRHGGSPVIVLVVAGLLLTACGSAQDVADSSQQKATDPTESSLTESSPTETSPTETTSEPSPTQTTPTTTSPTKKPPKLAGRPAVGNCYETGRKAFANQRDGSFPVPCAKRHTAETFAVYNVGAVPAASDIDRVWRVCQPKFKEYVGASPTVSTLGLTVVLPSAAQAQAGQGWIRCDAIQQPSYNGNRGIPRSGSVRGILTGGVPPQFRGCALHWPKPSQPVIFTSCRHGHQAELIPESLTLGAANAPFPGVQSTRSRSASFCEATFQDYVTETLNYYYYYPTRASWKSGSHDTTCWALDLKGDGLPPI
jgi:hypothetical protein